MNISSGERCAVAGKNRQNIVLGRTVTTRSPAETQALAAVLAGKLKPGAVLALHGELGSGKTCFVQGLAAALGVEGIVNSPTFTLINEYRGRIRLYHVDLYRVKSEAEFQGLGLEELQSCGGITAIEWPEIFARLLPAETLHLHFEYVDESRRRIRIGG